LSLIGESGGRSGADRQERGVAQSEARNK